MIRRNGKFEILTEFTFPGYKFEIVIGKHEDYENYVTWCYSKENDSYYWGHYFNNYKQAFLDFSERVNKEIHYMLQEGLM